MKKKEKRGSLMITMPIVLVISILVLVTIISLIFQLISPIILYQKLNTIVQKYAFIMEQFGELTSEEIESLEKELEQKGFDREKLKIEMISVGKYYGMQLQLRVQYKVKLSLPFVSQDKIQQILDEITLTVEKSTIKKR